VSVTIEAQTGCIHLLVPGVEMNLMSEGTFELVGTCSLLIRHDDNMF
jgi:hypothetical protein